jgi:hypothetical protein
MRRDFVSLPEALKLALLIAAKQPAKYDVRASESRGQSRAAHALSAGAAGERLFRPLVGAITPLYDTSSPEHSSIQRSYGTSPVE